MKTASNIRQVRASILSLAALIALAMGTLSAMALPTIAIDTKNPGNSGTEQVLLNNGDTGPTIYGTFNSSSAGAGYNVIFTSSGGELQAIASGQARIEGYNGNAPFKSLTFKLADDATFTKAIMATELTGNNDGNVTFEVKYVDAAGSPYSQTFFVTDNGNAFFNFLANNGARMTEITFSSTAVTFDSAGQFRMGGFAPGNLPDGGTTVALLGLGLVGIAGLRRKNG